MFPASGFPDANGDLHVARTAVQRGHIKQSKTVNGGLSYLLTIDIVKGNYICRSFGITLQDAGSIPATSNTRQQSSQHLNKDPFLS